jgi:hypothetical protein
MKEEASLANPFIGSQGVAGWSAHVAKAPPLCLKCVAVELKREIVEGKGGKAGEGGQLASNLWPICYA